MIPYLYSEVLLCQSFLEQLPPHQLCYQWQIQLSLVVFLRIEVSLSQFRWNIWAKLSCETLMKLEMVSALYKRSNYNRSRWNWTTGNEIWWMVWILSKKKIIKILPNAQCFADKENKGHESWMSLQTKDIYINKFTVRLFVCPT